MATPPAELTLAITDLAELASGDLRALWQQVSTADDARDALLDVLPSLVSTYALASATITADWYDDLRDMVEAKGRFRAIPAEVDDLGADKLARWGVAPLYDAEPDWRRTEALVRGGMQTRIANASRSTVARSSAADPAAAGWKRIGSGACSFCRMLIERDQLYTEATADFAAHDNCNCQAYPQIKGAEPIDVKKWIGPRSGITDADRARVREYLRTH